MHSEVLLLIPLSLVEPELRSGGVVMVPTPGLELRSSYGFIDLKSRPLSPVTKGFMDEIRRFEQSLVDHHAALAAEFASGSLRP